MIRAFKNTDLEKIAKIWLDTNLQAHNFIAPQYWQDNFELVKGMFLDAEIYVYEEDDVHGFVGLAGNYIAGIFVEKAWQSAGLGKQLLDHVKKIKSELSLSVYEKNNRAINFYKREGFATREEGIDEDTGEKEFVMVWIR